MEQLMRNRRVTDEEIAGILRDYEDGMRAHGICRKYNISEPVFYRIKQEYRSMRDMTAAYAKQRDRNFRLLQKKLKTQELEIKALKAALRKKF
jgi:hypothetical protein